MDPIALAALVFAVATTGVVLFQLALALGAPWGEYAMGGASQGRLPARLRVAAGVQAVVLASLAVVVLSTARVAVPALVRDAGWLVWIPVAFSALALVLNTITPSGAERRLWVPVTLVMLVSSLVVALGTR